MHGGHMNLDQRIREARSALQELTADEVELSRLEADQAAQIQALKASGSRDFAALADLEGKRNALASMIAEQRQAISQAQAELGTLEASKARGEALEDVRRTCAGLIERRETVDALLTELGDFVRGQLRKITEARLTWAADLENAQASVQATFQLPRPENAAGHYGSGSRDQERARDTWVRFLEEVGDTGAALLASPRANYVPGMYRPYAFRYGQHQASVSRIPSGAGFDEPIRLALRAAEADVLAGGLPHEFKGQA